MSEPIYFGCGEIVPGTEPIVVPNLPTPSPPVLVPDSDELASDVPPFIPPTGMPTKFKCVRADPSLAPDPGPGLQYVFPFFQYCLPCNGNKNTKFGDPPFNPSPADPDCLYVSKQECDINCPNPKRQEPGFTTTTLPGNTGGGGGVGFGRPVAGLFPHKCRQTLFICPQDIESSDPRILSISHACVPCSNFNQGGSNALVSTGSAIQKANQAIKVFESDCVYTSKSNCDQSCPPGAITGNFVQNCLDPLSIATQSISTGDPLNINVVNVQEAASEEPTTSNEPIGTVSQIFHNKYNFFSINTTQQTASTQSQSTYPEIFKLETVSNVGFLINNQGTQSAWTEDMLFSITNEMIEESLQPDLLAAFESIHRPGGQLVGKDNFISMIKRHLLEGTLDQVDASHYLTLANKQRPDQRIEYRGLSDKESATRVSLGLISVGGVPADTSKLERQEKRQGRRERRFLTDINARITTDVVSGSTDLELPLSDTGFSLTTSSGEKFTLTIGDGDGYYIASKLSDGTPTPLFLTTDVDKTFYVPADVRYNSLTLAGEDASYTLEASAVSGQNEIVSGDLGVSSLVPLYLILDISSVNYTTNNANPLVANYKGDYHVESDQTLIDKHSTNNGMSVSRINLDYNDPLYRYILDTGKASLSLNDVNFSNMLDPKDYPNGVRIARNIPFGIIITPVVGSKFNPFNGKSRLSSFVEPFVRIIQLSPDINVNDTEAPKPDMEERNLFDETGNYKVGLAEPADTQSIVYKYESSSTRYTECFYKDGVYTTSSDFAPVSTPGESYIIREVIDYITDNYSNTDISWYDVIRRMPLNKVGEFLYLSNARFIRNGLKINSVFNTSNDVESLLLADDDKTIIKEEDR